MQGLFSRASLIIERSVKPFNLERDTRTSARANSIERDAKFVRDSYRESRDRERLLRFTEGK